MLPLSRTAWSKPTTSSARRIALVGIVVLLADFGRALADLLFEDGIARASYERWLVGESAKVKAVVEVLLDDIIRRLEQVPNRYEAQSAQLAVALALAGREPAAIDALAEFAGFARGPQLAALSQKFIDAFAHHFGIEQPRLPAG